MSFYENNIQRIRSDILNIFNDDEDAIPCSKKTMCDLKKIITENDESELPPIDDIDDSKLKIKLQSIDDDDDDSDYEKELDIIQENENKLKILKSNYFSCESIPIKYDDAFVDNLIRNELDETLDTNSIYTNFDDKSYKISINSGDPEQNYNLEENIKLEEEKFDKKHYKTFEAFYENYINNNNEKLKQLNIFNKIICNNLIQHPFLTDIINEYREYIVELWLQKFNLAQTVYKFSFSEPKKWIKRAELVIFNSKLKKPILEYIQLIGTLLVLFDVNLTYKLNKHLYKNIEMENIKPINFKKEMYTILELVNYHTYGKNISKILIQNLIDNICINQNINILNLNINLYNRVFSDSVLPLDECEDLELEKKVDQYILHDNNFPDILKQPIIYVDPDTHKIYIFDYHKLCSNFDEKNYVNVYTNKPFEQEFIEQCLEKMKNINLCNYCKDNCLNESKILKTIYQDQNFGPIILKFCSVDCFSDIEWKPKVILNTII